MDFIRQHTHTSKGPLDCQGCTDERKRCKLSKRKKHRHGRIVDNAIETKGVPRQLYTDKTGGQPYVKHGLRGLSREETYL